MISDYAQLPAASGAIGAEAVVITNVIDSGAGGNMPQGRVLRGYLSVLTGAAVTSVTVRVRQNSLTGTLIGVADITTVGAAINVSIPFSKQDNSAAGAPIYVVTLQSTGGTTTVNDGNLEMFVPEPYGSLV